MALTFPSSPALNDETTTGGRTYKWNGEAWELVGSGIPGPTGPAGEAGAAGATGPAGEAGTTGPTGPDYSPTVGSPTELGATGVYVGYDPGPGDIFRLAASTAVRLEGLGITGPPGDARLLLNVGATGTITLAHATGPANAAFAVPWQGDYVMSPNGGAALVLYDATSEVWRVV